MKKKLSKNKLNFIMIFSYMSLFLIAGYFVHKIFYSYAIETNLEKARQFREELMITRHYLSNIASKIEIKDEKLPPFSITPAYVSSYIASEMSKSENIYIKQTSMDYRNPQNAPDKFEKEILIKYKSGQINGEYYELNNFNGKESLRYTYPIFIEKQCLACHGTPLVDVEEKTYNLLKQTYGDVAFNYKLNELRGMLSIAIDTKLIDSTVSKLDRNIFLLFIFFIFVVISILYIEKRFIYKPQIEKIKHLNATLVHRVQEEIEKNRKKEHILVEQSKLAQMGEMMNMIAHQWRQPLHVISTQMIHLKLKQNLGTLTDDYILTTTDIVSAKTQELSKIIDDFMKFNQPGSLSKFYLDDAVKNVYSIINKQIQNKDIILDISAIGKDIEVFHNQKAIEHVLLNLIVNSRDAFDEHQEIENKKIDIQIEIDEQNTILKVIDNAGGIPTKIINKVFNPYFTTKEDGKGTGIGLYMSKKMVEEVSGSKIKVKVKDNQTIFYILFPK